MMMVRHFDKTKTKIKSLRVEVEKTKHTQQTRIMQINNLSCKVDLPHMLFKNLALCVSDL